jgi:hypothetical protein
MINAEDFGKMVADQFNAQISEKVKRIEEIELEIIELERNKQKILEMSDGKFG